MGAFEDRLAEGYRQAANTPAKMPQPTTPTEALAQALERTGIAVDIRDWWACDEAATSILAALPPGWRLVGPDDVTVTVDGLTRALNVAAVSIGTPFPVFTETRACAAAILAALSANHTPSASTGRPCTFRPAWVPKPCGKPESDPTHAGQSDRKMPGQHVYRNKGR